MLGGCSFELSRTRLHWLLPEPRRDLRAVGRNDAIRQTLQPENISREKLGDVLGRVKRFREQEGHPFATAICLGCDRVELGGSHGEICCKVHGDGSPSPGSKLKRLRCTKRFTSPIFAPLARLAASTLGVDISRFVTPVDPRY